MTQPNILFLMTDQHRWDALGCVNSLVQTPHLDALAARGIRFSEAVCNAPMCMPSRHSLMSGLYPSQLGARHNTNLFASDRDAPLPFLPEQLRRAGYQTVGLGKTHWYERQAGTPYVASTRGFEIRAVARESHHGDREEGSLMMGDDEPENWNAFEEETAPYGPGHESVAGYLGCTSRLAADAFPEGWLTRRALHFLDHQRDPSRPFFLYLSLDKPHAGFNVPAEFEARYNLADIPDTPQPPVPPDELHVTPDHRSASWARLSPEDRRRSVLRYFALCSFVDDCIGRVLRRLEEIGELENTHVIFLSDHGEMLGERGWRWSKYCFYEGSVRVPLIVAGPAVPPDLHGSTDARCAELVDVMPTLQKWAGLAPNPSLPGRDLLAPAPARRGALCEMHGKGYESHQAAPSIMWRTPEWKLILSIPGTWAEADAAAQGCRGELYDLRRDPGEWHNLFHDPAHASTREALTRDLLLRSLMANAAYPWIPGRPTISLANSQ